MKKTIPAATFLLISCLLVYVHAVYSFGHDIDETFHVKSALLRPQRPSEDPAELHSEDYFYSVDHPTLKRHIYRWVLNARGITRLDIQNVDYEQTLEWNLDQGRLPPFREVVVPLRWTNAAFVIAAVLLVYFTAYLVTRAPYLSLLSAVPLVLDYRIASGVVAYLGTDAILAFFLALSLFVLVLFDAKGIASRAGAVVVLGIIGGLAASVKFNGALVAIAYCVYLAAKCKGVDRIAKPALAALISLAVFVALNPILQRSGVDWVSSVIGDMLSRRTRLWVGQRAAWFLPRPILVARFFPHLSFLFTVSAALLLWRKRKGLAAAAIWAGVLVVGTVASVNCTFQRYHLPVTMSVYLLAGVAVPALLRHFRGKDDEGTAQGRARAAIPVRAIAATSLVLLVTAVAGLELWGPARVRTKIDRTRRVVLFWGQAAARFGVGATMPREEARAYLAGPAGQAGAQVRPLPEPLPGALVQRCLNVGLFILAAYLLFRCAARLSNSVWIASGVTAVFIWNEFALGGALVHPTADLLLLVLALLVFDVASRLSEPNEAFRPRYRVLLVLLGAACVGASGAGVLVASGIAVVLYLSGGGKRGLLWAGGSVAAAAILFPFFELAFWFFGAKGTHEFVHSVSYALNSLGLPRAVRLKDLLGPVRDGFEYLALLPLAGLALYALRRQRWAAPVAVLAGFILVGRAVTYPESLLTDRVLGDFSPQMLPDVNLALSLGVALPGLILLGRLVSVKVALKEIPEAAD
ncbi:MAG: phospholipid carrier-dependent glycosyltransferase [Planctomycetota bacterium]